MRLFLAIAILGLLTLAAYQSGWLFNNSNKNRVNLALAQRYVDAFAEGVSLYNFDHTGRLRNTLSSPQVWHYNDDTATFFSPYLVMYEQTRPAWTVAAAMGQAYAGIEKIQLQGGVRLHQPAAGKSAAVTITTAAMTIFPGREYAETTEPIMLAQPGLSLSAVGARAFMRQKRIELLTQVRGRYVPPR